MIDHLRFEIKVGVVGCKSCTTNSFLNAVLGDKFLPVEGFQQGKSDVATHSFRIIPERFGDGHNVVTCTADFVHDEITSHSKTSQASNSMNFHEVNYIVSSKNDLTQKLRDDCTFVFVNLPAIDGTKRDTGNLFWQKSANVDRIMIVIDPTIDDDSDCDRLLHLLRRSVRTNKKVPVTVLCILRENTEDIRHQVHRLSQEVRLINEQVNQEQMSTGKINLLRYDSDDEEDVTMGRDIEKENMSSLSDNRSLVDFLTVSMDSGLDVLIGVVQDLAGDVDRQCELLREQKARAMERLDATTFFTRELFCICERYVCVEDDPISFVCHCVDHFWNLYQDCEEYAFSIFETKMDPVQLANPLEQLMEFKLWVDKFDLESQKANLEAASKALVRRQLQLILQKNSLWSFDEWYNRMNSNEWKREVNPFWGHLSPSDWNTIISSVLLISSDYHFYESFGREKILLERARFLSNHRLVTSNSGTTKFLAADGCPSLERCLDGSYQRGVFRPKYPSTFECVVRFNIPDKVSQKKHWGHIAWKHCQLMRSLESNS